MRILKKANLDDLKTAAFMIIFKIKISKIELTKRIEFCLWKK